MNVDFRCEHCGKLLSASAHANEPVRCPHCQKLTGVPAGLASLPRPKMNGTASPSLVAPGGAAPSGEAPLGGEATAAPQGAFLGVLERMMPFVISLFFHLGLVLVTVFLGTMLIEKKEAPKEIVVPGVAVSGDDDKSGGTLTPSERPTITASGGGSRFSKVTESTARSTIIAAAGGSGNARPGMAMLGTGGAVGGTGEGTGTGNGPGWFSGGAGGGSFFGMGGGGRGSGLARHIVYVVDRSGSMIDTFDAVRLEMLTSIGQLDGTKQDFHVILFAQGKPQEPVDNRLVPATPEFKRKASTGLMEAAASGQTDPIPALTRAFDVMDKATEPGGKVLFLLTDSDFPDNAAVVKLCKARNAKKDIHIYTFLYGSRVKEAEETMKQIAAENGGKYKIITPE